MRLKQSKIIYFLSAFILTAVFFVGVYFLVRNDVNQTVQGNEVEVSSDTASSGGSDSGSSSSFNSSFGDGFSVSSDWYGSDSDWLGSTEDDGSGFGSEEEDNGGGGDDDDGLGEGEEGSGWEGDDGPGGSDDEGLGDGDEGLGDGGDEGVGDGTGEGDDNGGFGEGEDEADGEGIESVWFNIKDYGASKYIYLYQNSLGKYTGEGEHGFKAGKIYELDEGDLDPLNYFANVLRASGYTTEDAEIELKASKDRLYPYFTKKIWESDQGELQYTAEYYYYDFLSSGWSGLTSLAEAFDGKYASQESNYSAFVDGNYTDISRALREFLLQYLEDRGIIVEDYNDQLALIRDVAACVRTASWYNIKMADTAASEKAYKGKDIVTHFLTSDTGGVCRHYAMTATMIYRALGLPARYVYGFAVPTEQNKWVIWGDDMWEQGHAWTEIYLSGYGWVPVEVTGSSSDAPWIPEYPEDSEWYPDDYDGEGFPWYPDEDGEYPWYPGEDEGDGEGDIPGGGGDNSSGTPGGDNSSGKPGGDNSSSGSGGNSSSSDYRPDESTGDKDDTPDDDTDDDDDSKKYDVTVRVITPSAEMVYDGTPLYDTNIIVEFVDGVEYEWEIAKKTSIKTVGIYKNVIVINVYDETGKKLRVKQISAFGTLEIKARKLIITTESAMESGDEAFVLTCEKYTVEGLLSEHKANVVITGEQVGPGSSQNTIDISKLKIKTVTGTDVTKNYEIIYKYGTLTVLPEG